MALRFLIVDDSNTSRRYLRRCLQAAGLSHAEMVEARDGLEALEILKTQAPFQVLFVDWYMPRLDGLSLIKAIAKSPCRKEASIVMITSETSLDRYREAVQAGVEGYVTKPFQVEELRRKLMILVRRRLGRRVSRWQEDRLAS